MSPFKTCLTLICLLVACDHTDEVETPNPERQPALPGDAPKADDAREPELPEPIGQLCTEEEAPLCALFCEGGYVLADVDDDGELEPTCECCDFDAPEQPEEPELPEPIGPLCTEEAPDCALFCEGGYVLADVDDDGELEPTCECCDLDAPEQPEEPELPEPVGPICTDEAPDCAVFCAGGYLLADIDDDGELDQTCECCEG